MVPSGGGGDAETSAQLQLVTGGLQGHLADVKTRRIQVTVDVAKARLDAALRGGLGDSGGSGGKKKSGKPEELAVMFDMLLVLN